MTILPVILRRFRHTAVAIFALHDPQAGARLAEHRTMLQATALRTRGLGESADHCLIVCNETHRFSVAEQLAAIEMDGRIILEPKGGIPRRRLRSQRCRRRKTIRMRSCW